MEKNWCLEVHIDGMHCVTKAYILTPEFINSTCSITPNMGDFPNTVMFDSYFALLQYIIDYYDSLNIHIHDWYENVIFKDYVNEELTHIINMNDLLKEMPELKV